MVKMTNQVTSKIVDTGKVIPINDKNANKLVLKVLRHVSEMRTNLISASKLDEVKMINQFGDRK